MELTLVEIKEVAKVFALVAAGLFFCVKLVSGYAKVNLSTRLKLERQRGENGKDVLMVRVELVKGDRATLMLHDVSGRVSSGDGSLELVFPGLERKSFKMRDTGRRSVAWKRSSRKTPYLQLVAGDSMEVATAVDVPRDAICEVEVRVLGCRKRRKKTGQWLATGVSVPATGG